MARRYRVASSRVMARISMVIRADGRSGVRRGRLRFILASMRRRAASQGQVRGRGTELGDARPVRSRRVHAAATATAAGRAPGRCPFNDFHGHLQPPTGTDATLGAQLDPSDTPVGGAEYLASTLTSLRAGAPNSVTVAGGDLVGASPFLSGLFHDEPAVESLNALGLDVSSVGNHEFDEGVGELVRLQYGGVPPRRRLLRGVGPRRLPGRRLLVARRQRRARRRTDRTVLPEHYRAQGRAASRSATSA